MMRPLLSVASLVSLVLFPWLFTVALSLVAATVEPLVPFGIGLLADTLYYSSQSYPVPVYALAGAVVSGVAIFVRRRLRTGMMG